MKLITFTPYARDGQAYFEAIAECMALLGEDDVAIIQDHDILHTTPNWHRLIAHHVAQGVRFATCRTNRIGCDWQLDTSAPQSNDDAEHFAHGHKLAKKFKGLKQNYTKHALASGHLLVIARRAWDKAMTDTTEAPTTVLSVDNYIHQKMRTVGIQLYLMADVYVYHRYRFGNKAAKGHLQLSNPLRKVCYTIITGDYDTLQEPQYITPGWEYHAYHDGRLEVNQDSVWKLIKLKNTDHLPSVLLQRANKAICPVKPIAEGEWLRTVYVDGNQVIIGNLDVLVAETGHERGPTTTITSKEHPERYCVWDEASAIVRLNKAPAGDVVRLLAHLNDLHIGRNAGLSETGILIRDYTHTAQRKYLAALEAKWSHCICNYCHRDQLSFDPIFSSVLNMAAIAPFEKCFRKVAHGSNALPVASKAIAPPPAKEYPLTVFTVADSVYAKFTPLFVASVLWSNPEARVEVVMPENVPVPDMLPVIKRWPDRFIITRDARLNDESTALYGTMRWLIEPVLKSKYLYIADIDIIVMQDIMALHLPMMRKWGMPYSNAVRPGTQRMTGLHFTETSALHPNRYLTDNQTPIRKNDEMVLYEIVTTHGHGLPPEFYRPVPGIHISPNRQPHKSTTTDGIEIPGWGIEGQEDEFKNLRATVLYDELLQVLHPDVITCLSKIDAVLLLAEQNK